MGILDAPSYSRGQADATFAPGAVPAYITGSHTKGYDRRLNVYNLKPSHLRRTRAKLGQVAAGAGDCRIGVVAHSMGAGVGATIGVSDWPTVLVNRLAARGYARKGSGLVAGYKGGVGSTDPRWTLGAGWGSFGGSSSLLTNNSTTNLLTHVSTDLGTVVDVWFAVTGSTGTYDVSIDGATAVTVTPTGSGAPYLYSVTGLANTVHTVTIKRNTATGFVFGVDVHGTAAGVRLYNGGIGGQKASAIADTGFYATAKFAGAANGWNSDLVFVGPIVTNDELATPATAVATWKAQVEVAITSARAGGADVILTTDTPISGGDHAVFNTALYELADSLDLPLLDMTDRWGSYAVANGYGQMSDVLHPNATGYADWAAAELALLLAA